MARKVTNFTVTDEGRDKGKTFVITEMSADQLEAWAARALLLLMGSGAEVPEDAATMGVAGLVSVGFKALSGLRFEVVAPLLEEMMECVQAMPDPSRPHVLTPLFPESIEEVMTRFQLRKAWWELHTSFLAAAARLNSEESPAASA